MIAIQKAIYIHVCNSVTLKISIHLNHPCHKLVHCLQKCPYDPTIPLLGIYPEETKIEKNSCTPVFIAALFTTARRWKKPRCQLTDEWIRKLKLWYILLSYKKKYIWVCSKVDEVDELRAYYTEWSKSEVERQISYINTYIWNLER